MQSIRPLKKHQNHHNKRPYPNKSPSFSSRKSQSQEPMMKVSIVPIEGIFFKHKNPIKPNPSCIKQRKRKRHYQSPNLISSSNRKVSNSKPKKHNSHVSHQSERLILNYRINQTNNKKQKRQILNKEERFNIRESRITLEDHKFYHKINRQKTNC